MFITVFKRGVSMFPIVLASTPMRWLLAAVEKGVLRAGCHDGPSAHTRPCDTFGSLGFRRLAHRDGGGNRERRQLRGPSLPLFFPPVPSNKEARDTSLNQYCAPLRGRLGRSLVGYLALTVCSGLHSGDTGHSDGKRPARPLDVLTLTAAFKCLQRNEPLPTGRMARTLLEGQW